MLLRVALLCAVLCGVAVECGHAATKPATKGFLNIGGVFPLLQADGQTLNTVAVMRQAGFLMAVNEINNKTDGIADDILPNVHVRRACRDSHRTFANTVLGAIDMVAHNFRPAGAHAVIGAGDNAVSEALGTYLAGVNVAQISYGSTATELSHSDNYPTFLRVVPSDGYQGAVFADIIANHYGWTRAISIASDDNLGADATGEFVGTAAAVGLNVPHTASFSTGTQDFSAVINELRPYDCRVFVFLIDNPEDASNLLLSGFNAGLFNMDTTIFFSQTLAVPATYQKVVAKYGQSMMQGHMFLQPSVNYYKTQSDGQAFINRFRAQPDTVTILPNGQRVCHNDTDDTGEYLYRVVPTALFPTDPHLCAGMQFSKLHADGSDASSYMGFAYDAAMAVFRAVDFLIKKGALNATTLGSTEVSGTLLKRVLTTNISFAGVTGPMAFSNGRLSSKTYGYGDRSAGQGYLLYNYQVVVDAINPSGGMYLAGIWLQGKGVQLCTPATFPEWLGGYPTPSYLGGCSLPLQTTAADGVSLPPDRRPDVIQRMPAPLKGFFLFLALVVFFMSAVQAFMIFVVKAHTRLVKASQPVMMGFIVLGQVLGGGRILMSYLDLTTTICHLDLWFGHLSFAAIFFSMIVKTWRVHMIIQGGLRKVKITSTQVALYTVGLCMVSAVLCALYSGVGKPQASYIVVPLITGNNLLKPTCTYATSAFDAVLFSLEGVALVMASYLCYCTRSALDAVNESQNIATAVLVIVFIASHTPIILFLPVDPYVDEVIVSCCFFLAILGASLAYFGEKMKLLFMGADLNAQFKVVYGDGSFKGDGSKESSILRRASEGDVNNGVRIPDDEREQFFAQEVPVDVTPDYAVRRIALWQQFRDELQMRILDADRSGKQSKSKSKSGVADAMFDIVAVLAARKSGKGFSEASEGRMEEGRSRPGSEHGGPPRAVSDIVDEIKGKMAPRSPSVSLMSPTRGNSISFKTTAGARSPSMKLYSRQVSIIESGVVDDAPSAKDGARSGLFQSRPVSEAVDGAQEAAVAAAAGDGTDTEKTEKN